MKEELEQKLMDRFKFMEARNLWSGKKLNFPVPCSHGDGWFQLIWDLCEKIEAELMKLPENVRDNFYIEQIKEKYAGLRFYVNSANNAIFEAIHKAEEKSYEICEVCGNKGEVKGDYWVRTLCTGCYNKKHSN